MTSAVPPRKSRRLIVLDIVSLSRNAIPQFLRRLQIVSLSIRRYPAFDSLYDNNIGMTIAEPAPSPRHLTFATLGEAYDAIRSRHVAGAPIHLQVAADVTEVRCSRRMRQQPRLN